MSGHCKRARVQFEPLEDRKLLTVYVNDNWVDLLGGPLQIGDFVTNDNDLNSPGSISGFYGVDAFGTGSDGSNIPGADKIADAVAATSDGETLVILGGTYTESDIVIDHPMTLSGDGAGGAAQTLIVPETTSSGDLSNFGPGTHSGIIIYAPSVTVENLRLDGNGNGTLSGSLNFHQGITTLYDMQNGGDYSSLHNGPLPPIQLGAPSSGDANIPQESVPSLLIQNVEVDNVFWHGITISALADQTFDTGPSEDHDLTIKNATVTNVGDVADLNRVGILMQNVNDNNHDETLGVSVHGNIQYAAVTGASVGIKTAPWGSNMGFGSAAGGNNQARVTFATVSEAKLRGYEIDFGSRREYQGLVAQWAAPSNATGVYVNRSRAVLSGLTVTNAKIGVHVQNSLLGSPQSNPTLAWGSVLTGPGSGVVGSIGVLVDNDASEPNSANMALGLPVDVTGYETGVVVQQNVPPYDAAEERRDGLRCARLR